jgi:hypothetical protein
LGGLNGSGDGDFDLDFETHVFAASVTVGDVSVSNVARVEDDGAQVAA